ncbi:MAG TPA: hypothetical protein VJT67_06785 [Longimicrobiaceae bacterium]|nr:hypothetical protein [Longimicrobiaceae bacterium]
MKRTTVGFARWALPLLAAAIAAVAGDARAQNLTVYGTAGVDGNHTNIELLGGTVRFGDLGWAPEVALQGYHLGFDAGADTRSIWAVTPSAGMSLRTPVGQVGARVGYSFQSDDSGGVPIIEGEGGGSGVVVAAQGNYWGPGPELQGIATYNFGAEYLWTQAQALVPLLPVPPGRLSGGAEVVWQGSTQSGGGNAIQLGPVLKFSTGHNFSVNAGGGWKHFGGSSTADDTWYAHVGFVKYGIQL